MTKEIHGVPESITREAFTSLFEAAGIDPKQTLELKFNSAGIHATVFALDADGKRYFPDMAMDGFAKHVIYIPVED